MARPFDHGKRSYRSEHVASSDQETRHILSDDLLQHYGAKPENYSMFSERNYRMGSKDTNCRDRRLDNAIAGEVFGVGPDYDAYELTRPSPATGRAGLSYQQQLNGIGRRFDMAKLAYEETGEYKYYMMQKDLRTIADEHLDADLRGFRLSTRR